MGNYDKEAVEHWAWSMEDTASYTVGGGSAYRDSLDLLLGTALEKGLDPYSLDAETLAHVNQAARFVIQNTLDIYAHDDEVRAGEEALNG